jgi:hypothetical protein
MTIRMARREAHRPAGARESAWMKTMPLGSAHVFTRRIGLAERHARGARLTISAL